MPHYFTYTQKDKKNLKKCDPIFAKYIDRIGDIEIQVRPDLFIALVHSIIGQQISVKAHATIWNRFVNQVFVQHEIQHGSTTQKISSLEEIPIINIPTNNLATHNFLQDTEDFSKEKMKNLIIPKNIANMSEEKIQNCGMSFKKAQNIIDFAKKVHMKEFNLEELKNLNDKEVIQALCTLKGVGQWTAEMMMLFSMQRPNILSLGDLAIQKALCRVFAKEKLTKEDGRLYQEKFSPYGSLASLYLWQVIVQDIKI